MDDKYVYIVSGDVVKRGQRKRSEGVLLILGRNYDLLTTKAFPGSKDFVADYYKTKASQKCLPSID